VGMALLCGMSSPEGSIAKAGPVDDCNQVGNFALQEIGCTAYIKRGIGAPENLATAHINRANVYARRGEFSRAFADYAAASALDPTNPLAPYNRGNAYLDTRRYKHAIASYTRAIALDAKFKLAYYNRGLAQEKLGNNEAAAADYRRVLALDPTAKSARLRLKRMHTR
jgi:tetratricopeptide (TPR) repeat protein